MPACHLIAFNIPYPANYGGVIDVFFKIKALHQAGVAIHLHCFEYGRSQAPELEQYCTTVHYYPRNTGWQSQCSFKPYIVNSRCADTLLQNLLQVNAPILFEGLHCCYYLTHPKLVNHLKIVRMHNIEWEYYLNLFKIEKHWGHRIFFLIESIRLYYFQRQLNSAQKILAISPKDSEKLSQQFNDKVHYCPPFHGHSQVSSLTGKGQFVLFHGDLSVLENEKGALFLIDQIFNKPGLLPLIIAGRNPGKKLQKKIAALANVQLIPSPSHDKLQQLIREAHINLLISSQSSGMKLKLINVLFNGRFCIVNSPTVEGTPLDQLCIIANQPQQIIEHIQNLTDQPFSAQDQALRAQQLEKTLNEAQQAQLIKSLL